MITRAKVQRVKLYEAKRKGEYFIHKGERVYLRECQPTKTYDGTVVYCWLNHVGMYFETTVVGDYCETYWVFKK